MPFAAKLLHLALRGSVSQGPRSKFSSGGAKEECAKEFFLGGWGGGAGGGPCLWISIQFLYSDGECYYNDKTIDFFPHRQ